MPRSQGQARQLSSAGSPKSEKPSIAEARPSSSIILLSPTNQVLLLHRVQTSSSFPSAHVFPGGNLSPFHEPPAPPPDSRERHADSLAYRLAAVRETFEESGILIAKRSLADDVLLVVPEVEREKARREIHGDKVRFTEWVEAGLGGTLCVDDLVPFTRWVTPPNMPKRFTTQMYLYFMPLADSPRTPGGGGDGPVDVDVVQTPTSDGGVEHTAATFADASEWLRQQSKGEIVLFPPQCYLLTLVAQIFDSVSLESVGGDAEARYAAQRRALVDFVRRTPTTSRGEAGGKALHPSALIPWSEKVMSPHTLFIRDSDDRIVLGIDKPGPELKGSGAGGDFERVVLVKFAKGGPQDVEVRGRDEVLREEKAIKEAGKEAGKL
ncbi:NUDIX domain-containing protein [Diaporthe amygdali]|uniref:NUDIX domain-containing protein n=1 Tax=Phomopsis amygdali TaxID=1214568 RepID=UPI0022FF3E79|nr:NUDIX domain-containing protein [Diaporthe amygdali]KAJ0122614.1 NUDIX domain-containing protein [Diaporthe amygdali]